MIVKHPVHGKLVTDGDKVALHLNPDSDSILFLAYALVTQGPGLHILPSALLDDWGNEIKNPDLFQWIADNGLHFPRAEVFGVSPTGEPVQYFLRDIELFVGYPLYVFEAEDAPDSSARLAQAVLLTDDSIDGEVRTTVPDGTGDLLSKSQVSWWLVTPQLNGLGFI